MEKLVNKKLWFESLALYAMFAAKCVLVWDGGNGAARLGSIILGLLMLPALTSAGLWLVGKLQSKIVIDEGGLPALRAVLHITVGLFAYIYALMLFAPPEAQLHLRCIVCGLGVFMVLFGMIMPKLPRNRFAGVRYSWTVADAAVWKKSNAVGGIYTVLMGALLIVSGAIPQERGASPLTSIEIWAFVFYIVLITLHSRLIAQKAGVGKGE